MQTARRKKYLKALGIETWTRRGGAAVVAEPGIRPAVGVAEPQRIPILPAGTVAAPAATPAPVVIQVTNAEAGASVPRDWMGLRDTVKNCRKCRLCETRTNTVFGVGPEQAPLMVVGEGPGADEDAQGEPFVGRAGKLLDEMLKAIGRSRQTDTFIANVVKCRPPGNRNPAEDEAEACRGYLEQQLRLVKPKLIVALGAVAAKLLLQTETPVGKLRGAMHVWGPDATPLMVTYHPAYLLRSPGEKAKSWDDLKKIHKFLNL